MLCAIHQPNFFPWLGYFNKIYRSDVFVFLDDVDYPKSGHSMSSYCNRVLIKANNEGRMISCPVVREHGPQRIVNVAIKEDLRDWRQQLKDALKESYGSTKYYSSGMEILEPIIDFETDKLSEFNINAIISICKAIGIDKKFARQSEMNTTSSSTERLVEIVKLTGCDAYLCGRGAQKYQEDKIFEDNNIRLEHQNFIHPRYVQEGETFLEGCSIIDPLLSIGGNATHRLIQDSFE